MDDEVAVSLRITGRVQGVWYRGWVVDNAIELGLRGWVRNRFDGSVETLLAGPPTAVEEMVRRCHEGPPAARVLGVERTNAGDAGEVAPGFYERPTG
ncbi:MAG: acylphosphatase [Alphaproteobacteria bacterium]